MVDLLLALLTSSTRCFINQAATSFGSCLRSKHHVHPVRTVNNHLAVLSVNVTRLIVDFLFHFEAMTAREPSCVEGWNSLNCDNHRQASFLAPMHSSSSAWQKRRLAPIPDWLVLVRRSNSPPRTFSCDPIPETPTLSAQGPGSQVWRPEHLKQAIDAASVALWSWNVDNDHFTMDARAFDLWGLPWAAAVSFEELSAHIHPADRNRVRSAFKGTRSVAGPYEIDFRIMLGEDVRWVSARGRGADEGIDNQVMFGIFLDVTSRKQAEESSELLAGEMSHRVKNLLAIATSLTHISHRSANSPEDMANDLIQRLTALGRAHDLVRPIPGSEGKAALLGDLISILLAPYDDPEAFAGRIRVAVPRMGIGDGTATTLAMVIHELATNSVKHGALSVREGTLDISGTCDQTHLLLVWAEDGGPPPEGIPEMSGFGSKMIARSMSQQFDGALTYDWQPSGLVVNLRMSKVRLSL